MGSCCALQLTAISKTKTPNTAILFMTIPIFSCYNKDQTTNNYQQNQSMTTEKDIHKTRMDTGYTQSPLFIFPIWDLLITQKCTIMQILNI